MTQLTESKFFHKFTNSSEQRHQDTIMENLRLRHTASNGVDRQANDVKAEIIIHNKFGKSKFVWQALLSILVAYTIYLALVASPVDPQPFITNFTVPRFVGALTPNNKLQRVEKLFNGRILGPESIVKDNKGNYYTGLADGRIVKLFQNGSMEEIARTGNNNGTKFCDGTYDTEAKCGRPLGLRFDDSGENILFCDAYRGLIRVNVTNKTTETLVASEEGIDGLPFHFLNDVAIGENDMVYFTDSSWKWQRRDSRYAVLEATGRGRLVSYNIRTKEKKLLMSGLFIPNGLLISSNKDFLLLTETTKSSVLRYNLKGPNAGQHTTFAENLPGYPANIRKSPTGGYWVGLIAVRKQPFSFLDMAGPYPFMRTLLAKMMSQQTMSMVIPSYGMILRLDEDGKIMESLHDPSGKIMDEIVDVYEDTEENVLILGSYKHNFLGRLPLQKVRI